MTYLPLCLEAIHNSLLSVVLLPCLSLPVSRLSPRSASPSALPCACARPHPRMLALRPALPLSPHPALPLRPRPAPAMCRPLLNFCLSLRCDELSDAWRGAVKQYCSEGNESSYGFNTVHCWNSSILRKDMERTLYTTSSSVSHISLIEEVLGWRFCLYGDFLVISFVNCT